MNHDDDGCLFGAFGVNGKGIQRDVGPFDRNLNEFLMSRRRFERRFGFIEARLEERGSSPEAASLEEMDALWDAAKREGL